MEKINVTPAALEQIFQMQKDLMEHYIRIEGLPQYPLDLTQKPAQKVINDFKGRIIAEMSEAYDTLLQMWVDENDNVQYDREAALTAYNEELADVLHFFIETLIFSGIDSQGIYNMLRGIADDNPGTETFLHQNSTWLTLFHFATFQNMRDRLSYNQLDKSVCFRIMDQGFINTVRPDLAGAMVLGSKLMVTHNEFLWEITYMLNRAVGHLKQKDWAQSEMTANLVAYHRNIFEAFLHFFRYLDFIGQNPIGMFAAYARKNIILKKRISDGY